MRFVEVVHNRLQQQQKKNKKFFLNVMKKCGTQSKRYIWKSFLEDV